MRRVIFALASTAAGLVLLLSFRSHSPGSPETTMDINGAGPRPGPAGIAGGAHANSTGRPALTLTAQSALDKARS